MKQVYLKLFLCYLLTISATGQYNTGQRRAAQQFSTEQGDSGNYGIISGRSDGGLTADDFASYNQQLSASASPWIQYTGPTTYTQELVQTNLNQQPSTTSAGGSVASKVAVMKYDQSNGAELTRGSSYVDYSNYKPYTEPTGPPYGIQSTGEILVYQPEKLDLSKCGPQPTSNPCKILGPQYYELPGYPECYVQCAFGRMFVKPCPTDLVWNSRIKNCDWKTIAPSVSDNEYSTIMYGNNANRVGSTSYDTVNRNYETSSSYSYGRKKRSTTERKKRSLAAGSPQYQALMMKQVSQPQFSNYFGASIPHPTGPLRIPLTPFSLPGPVSYPATYGIASLPSPVASQQTFPTAAAPGASVATGSPLGVARSTFGIDGSYSNWFGVPTRMASEGIAQIPTPNTPALAPAPATSTPTPTTGVATQTVAVASAPNTNGLSAPAMSTVMSQPNPIAFNPYAAPTPVSLQATLIPGPFYPYGPPLGGPFGGPLPKPVKPAPSQTPSIIRASTPKSKTSTNDQIIKHFGNQAVPTSGPIAAQPFGAFASQSPAMLRSIGAQSLPFLSQFTGQFPSPAMSFAHSSFQSAMPFISPSLQSALSWTSQYQPNFKQLSFPGQLGSTVGKQEEQSPLGSSFDLYLLNNQASEEDDTDESAAENEGVNTDQANSTADKGSEKVLNESTDNTKASSTKRTGSSKKNRYIYNAYVQDQMDEDDDDDDDDDDEAPYQFLYRNRRSKRQASFATSPCLNKPPRTYTAHPTDPTKYVACFNQFYYQFMDCPSSLIYNAITNKCEKRKGLESICEREQPCMNKGQCYQTGPKAYKCTCRGDWTGERCETPLSSCVNNPCGQGNDCVTLKTSDAKQDYVCICNEGQSYGLSCGQNARPNPCLSSTNEQEQYYPFEYSTQAFIQCNGDLLHVQPCPSGLHWNPAEQVCDVAVTVPEASNGRQLQSYEITYNNEQQKLLNIPSASTNRVVSSQQTQPTTNTLSVTSVQNQRNMPRPTHNYALAQDQSLLMGRSLVSPKPLEKPDVIKMYVPKPKYDDIFDETPVLSYLHQQNMRPLSAKN